MIEKWHESVEKGSDFGALVTDLSKTFDCLPRERLITKLNAYGFEMKSLNLIYDFLSNRNQKIKVGGVYSSWHELLYGVPQGSILWPLLFIIFLCDLIYFLKCTIIASYADDTTLYNANLTQEIVINNLEELSSILFKWFNNKYMKVNTDKIDLPMFSNKKAIVNIDNICIKSEDVYEILEIEFVFGIA